jgi:hypothetical protein
MRGSSRSTLGWAFGVSLSVLLVSLWGRAIVVDTETLGESLAPLSRSETVIDFVADWMADEMVESGVDPALVDPIIDQVLESSAVGQTLDLISAEVVAAAASTDPEGSNIDMRLLIAPAIPEVTLGLAEFGYPVPESQVREVVEGLDPLVIRQPGAPALVGPGSPTASRLGTASMLAALALVVFGSGFIALATDRLGALRSLLNRVAVGGVSFALLLKAGSWVVDPGGGRAPVPETLSALADSKWLVPLEIGLLAALLAAAIYLARRFLRLEAASRTATVPPKRGAEHPSSLSRSR